MGVAEEDDARQVAMAAVGMIPHQQGSPGGRHGHLAVVWKQDGSPRGYPVEIGKDVVGIDGPENGTVAAGVGLEAEYAVSLHLDGNKHGIMTGDERRAVVSEQVSAAGILRGQIDRRLPTNAL